VKITIAWCLENSDGYSANGGLIEKEKIYYDYKRKKDGNHQRLSVKRRGYRFLGSSDCSTNI
jgi:hypothetical protein